MKVIFLDIDGVLNCVGSKSKMVVEDGDAYKGIDKHKILRLKEIVNRTGAKVVLTSTWRRHLYKRDAVDRYMRQRFGKYEVEIYSCVEYTNYHRGAGIHNWINEHPDIDGWVVLDDEWFLDYDAEINKHLILTEFYNSNGGLRDEHVDKACNILGGYLLDSSENIINEPDKWQHVGLAEDD